LPKADPSIRATLDARARAQGWPAMHARLAEVDALTAARLKPNDSQRIQRALEIFEITGKPMSSLFGRQAPLEHQHRFMPIALEPSERAVLHARIEQRFDTMMAAGFMDEVRALRARGDLHPGLPSMRCVGYRQAWAHLDGQEDAQEMRAQAIIATRQLAKRQLTWLRSMEDRIVFDCLRSDLASAVASFLQASV
jgi:tRNA dimethylallyltransferase